MSVNKTILVGNLTRDPETKDLPGGSIVAEFGLAMNRKFKASNGEDREEVTFVDCAAYGKTGEIIAKYFEKGKAIYVEGRLRFDSWEDKQGGGKRSKLSVVVESFSFLPGSRDEQGEQGSGDVRGSSNPRQQRDRGPVTPEGQRGQQQYNRNSAPRGGNQEPRGGGSRQSSGANARGGGTGRGQTSQRAPEPREEDTGGYGSGEEYRPEDNLDQLEERFDGGGGQPPQTFGGRAPRR
jgi:single-strand DNA-binding protein